MRRAPSYPLSWSERIPMRVKLTQEVLKDGAGLDDILTLVRHFVHGRHEWVVDPRSLDDIALFFRKHAPTRAQAYQELAQKSLVSQAWQSADKVQPVVHIYAGTVGEQVEDLSRPAVLVVEDLISDGSFVRAIAHAFGEQGVAHALDSGWLEIRHGGGKDRARDCAHDERQRFRHTIRLAILLDSDRMVPGEFTSCHKIAEALEREGIKTHVLELRETENYVPNHVLHTLLPYRDISKRITSLKELSQDQRGHFDMKKGFPTDTDGRGRIPSSQTDLFSGVPGRVVDSLTRGFGPNLNGRLRSQVENGRITAAHFSSVGDGVASELQGIL
ncbi:hypothetical protein ACFY8Z_11960 [Streptomyces microflavus]|uniref:hypothetical protein n=1 Tax=Streptomyces microflavus TaxID=1919 RepID=UPI0036EDA9A8